LGSEVSSSLNNNTLKYECPDIYLDDNVMDLKFSPTQNLIALSQVTGAVRLYGYTEETMDELATFN